MWPDRVSNPGPLTYESGAYRLRYTAWQITKGRMQVGTKERIKEMSSKTQFNEIIMHQSLVTLATQRAGNPFRNE